MFANNSIVPNFNDDDSTPDSSPQFTAFYGLNLWNDPSYSTNKEKILVLLSDYTKKDSAFIRFFTGHWNRHHVVEINSIYVLGRNKDVKKILEDLNGIQLVNAKGTVATLREFLREKIANPTQHNKTLLRS